MDMIAAGTPGVSWKILYLVWRQPKTDILTIYRLVVETPHLPPHISIFVLSLCNISSSFISSSIVNNLWVSSTPSNIVIEEFLLTHSSSQSYCWDPCISEDFICRKKNYGNFKKKIQPVLAHNVCQCYTTLCTAFMHRNELVCV